MTSVMPAWKQALIEKKRRKEQEEKTKTQVQEDRTASLPEWKKNLLARKKGLQGVDTNGLDKHSNIGNNTTVSGYDKLGQKRNSFTTNSTEREYESNLGKSSPKVIIIPKASSQNGTAARQHSFVASSVPQSDQQKENKQIDQKLSKNGQEKFNNQGIVSEGEENNSKVSYEHIKTPSELRKLFGIVSRDSVPFGSTSKESKKTQNQQTQAHRDVSTKPHRSSNTKDYEQSQKPTVNTYPQTYSRESITMKEKEAELPKSHTPANNEEEKENNIIIISRDNDTEISAYSEGDNRTKTVKDDEIPADLHVKVIRTKFGPSGNFRLHKSSSSDNLLNSKHQLVSPRSRGKPPPLNKRWSADVGGILSPTRSSSEDEDIFDSVINAKRMRSKSMGDVRILEDHPFHDMEPVVNLKHRASVSSGIERRLQVLLHNMSVSDGKNDDYEEVDDDVENTNNHLDQNVNHHFHDDSNKATRIGGSSGKQIDEDDLTPKIRKASWYNPEEDIKDTRLILTHQDYDLNEKPAVKPTISPSSSHELNKSSNEQEKIKANHYNIGRNEVAIDSKGKQVHNIVKLPSNQESGVLLRPGSQKTMAMNGRISHEPVSDESEKDEKPAKGSVYKLSSIFGSSISKGNKKDKKAKAKSDNNDQLLNQENISKREKKDSQKSSSSRIFSWSKKQKKSEPVNDEKGEQSKLFSGASSLRPVHQKVVEQKITGNMTLVLNANAGSYEPKQKQPKLSSANQAPVMGHLNSLSGQDSQLKRKDKNKLSLAVHKPDDMMVTAIDVPDPSSTNDVEVSAIDLPEPPSPTPVSVIDIPESPDHDVKVSVIDMPDNEVDSDDSDDSSSGMSGSYDINPIIESIKEEEEEEEEEEEDIDDVPVSYVGDSTYMKVPEVIFESKVENVKSCLSSPLRSRKRKAKVGFSASNLIKVHDYPSEECMQYHYDQYSKENSGKTIDQYRPSSLQGVEQNVRPKEKEEKETKDKTKVFNFSDNTELKNDDAAPTITYLDQGEAFTSSSSSGAILF